MFMYFNFDNFDLLLICIMHSAFNAETKPCPVKNMLENT